MTQKKIAVIGAGAMGLVCAYDLLKAGHKVDVFEQEDRAGGMSASFDFDGLNIERFYHFVCGPDYPLFNLLKELSIYDRLKWTETKMGFFYNGKLYKWGNPLFLLSFPEADLLSKLRYGLHLFLASKRTKWRDLDKVKAIDWIKKFVGSKAYDVFWEPLFRLKFYEYSDNISAAWIWTRIKRVALSRKNIFTERMGYIKGGSATLFHALTANIAEKGGKIYFNNMVRKINIRNGRVSGIELKGGQFKAYDFVISTIPLPYVADIADDLPGKISEKLRKINNVGVVCVILKLKSKLTENFWLNINDSSIAIPGMIEYSNLNPLKEQILYVPFYLHKDHPKYRQTDKAFIDEVLSYAKRVNPEFSEDWVLGQKVHRYACAQPVCPPEYLKMLPALKTEVNGLYIADTSYYYPEDRSISESVRLGREIAESIVKES